MNEVPSAFPEEVQAPAANVNAVPLPDDIDTETAARIGNRFMTSFHSMVHQADVSETIDIHRIPDRLDAINDENDSQSFRCRPIFKAIWERSIDIYMPHKYGNGLSNGVTT